MFISHIGIRTGDTVTIPMLAPQEEHIHGCRIRPLHHAGGDVHAARKEAGLPFFR